MPKVYPIHGGATKTALISVQQRGKMGTGRFPKKPRATELIQALDASGKWV
jgi:hypothetical protein